MALPVTSSQAIRGKKANWLVSRVPSTRLSAVGQKSANPRPLCEEKNS